MIKRLKTAFSWLGPGLITGVSDDEPAGTGALVFIRES